MTSDSENEFKRIQIGIIWAGTFIGTLALGPF